MRPSSLPNDEHSKKPRAIQSAFQRELSQDGVELSLNDAARLVGCWHGLSKRGPQFKDDKEPMRRAVAFTSTIAQSKTFTQLFPLIINQALENRSKPNAVKIEAQHVDGKTNVKVRSEAIAWLEEPPGQGVCRVLSNAKCLTEGVDVPALDAVMFLNPRKSIVDVVQAVGRVMRLAPGKEYGYVVLPIGVPAGVSPEEALRDNRRYEVVWQVLQALRSHDERLAAEINKIDLNKRSGKVIGMGIGMGGGARADSPSDLEVTEINGASIELPDLKEWLDALYARMVEKVGDRRYMEHWAADISAIAAAQETRIRTLLSHPEQNPQAVERFDQFLGALRQMLNDGITQDDAIGMLSQHLITRPVFEALFGAEEFTRRNSVSQAMQAMIDTLDSTNIHSETEKLEGFYEHVRMLMGDIHDAAGRQRVITQLYEQFFKKALPKTADRLGIVYTPVEIVDFILRGADELLRRHFDGATLSDPGIHVLDPFTGTGTFIARLLQSDLIRREDLERKYGSELHANDIMLLAYYIAAINIETAYEGAMSGDGTLTEYRPFEGIVLTDTFAMNEGDHTFDRKIFPRNNERADRQRGLDIRVIIGNPPWSVGQTSQNDDNENLKYPALDSRIEATYAQRSTATLKNSLYDSYIRAFRWASDRLAGAGAGGIVGFVSNGGWIDGNTADGVRHCFAREFHHIYVFNLRGNQRTSGELSKREGGKIFGTGSRNTVTITFLVREAGEVPASGAQIHYRDIGDYLTREEKLEVLSQSSVSTLDWSPITPNEDADWISQRDPRYDALVPLGEGRPDALFSVQSLGIASGRDVWVYNSSARHLRKNVESMNAFLNDQIRRVHESAPPGLSRSDFVAHARRVVSRDPTRHSWTRSDFNRVAAGATISVPEGAYRVGLYRPFMPQHVAFDRMIIEGVSQLPRLMPSDCDKNIGFSVVGKGTSVPFSVLATDVLPQLHMLGASSSTVFFARWRHVAPSGEPSLLSDATVGHERVSNLNPACVSRFQAALGDDISEDDVFAYAYGILHSPEFRETFTVNLKKEPPRIPLVKDRGVFDDFARCGEELLNLHIGFESVRPYPLTENWRDGTEPMEDPQVLRVGPKKMAYPKVRDPDTGKQVPDKTRLVYNDYLTLSDIPQTAHDYLLGTRSAIDWIIDRWYVKTDKASGIVNDVNQWGAERGEPRYIIELIKRVVTVSVRTVDIVNGLPRLSF